jgi:hypothetical protein
MGHTWTSCSLLTIKNPYKPAQGKVAHSMGVIRLKTMCECFAHFSGPMGCEAIPQFTTVGVVILLPTAIFGGAVQITSMT